ncbi:MAG: hypothetical protein H0W90_04700 [Actinobacteria bacterium]|nr:hypothetical protein [Actinomycetota bacterium]
MTNFLTGESRRSLGEVMDLANDDGLFNWWGLFFPGFAVVLLVAPIYFIGDGLRDALDPTERRYAPPRRRRKPSRVRAKIAAASPFREVSLFDLAGRLSPRNLPFDVFAPFRRFEPVVGVWAGAYSRRRNRRAARRGGAIRLLVETLVVFGLVAGAAVAIYLWQVNPVASNWRLAGTQIQNLSQARGAQSEASVAVSPSKPTVLLAASNDSLMRTIRVHSSTDGGRTWSSSSGPALGTDACAKGDPSVAIGSDGREYAAFTVNAFCTQFDPSPYLVVASRTGPDKPWTVRRIGRKRPEDSFDDKPSLAVGPDGNAHVAWSRLVTWTRQTTVISSSGDGGRSWSRPHIVSGGLNQPQLVNMTVSPLGTLYLTGVDAHLGVWVARSNDARTFVVRRVGPISASRASSCLLVGSHPIAEQANRCLGPNPTVSATRSRVYVTYGAPFDAPKKDVSIAVFDAALELLGRGGIGEAHAGRADRFWPTSAVDPRTGLLWTCFYDTTGDPSRKQAWFSCATSRDGRNWTTPVRAATASASPQVLWEDSRIYGFGDSIGYGGYAGLAVGGAVAHPAWIDTQDTEGGGEEVFSARIPAGTLRR